MSSRDRSAFELQIVVAVVIFLFCFLFLWWVSVVAREALIRLECVVAEGNGLEEPVVEGREHGAGAVARR